MLPNYITLSQPHYLQQKPWWKSLIMLLGTSCGEAIENEYLKASEASNHESGQVLTYTCGAGTYMDAASNANVTCQCDGQWSSFPTCHLCKIVFF